MAGGANTLKIRLEYAPVITFLYGQRYDCNEMYLAGLIAQRDLPLREMLDRYELYSYK